MWTFTIGFLWWIPLIVFAVYPLVSMYREEKRERKFMDEWHRVMYPKGIDWEKRYERLYADLLKEPRK